MGGLNNRKNIPYLCLSSLFSLHLPSLGFHPLLSGLVKGTSDRFIGMQLFLLILPLLLPVTTPSPRLPGNTHLFLRTQLRNPLQNTFLTWIPTPGILFSISLVTLCLSVLICEMG